MKKVGILHCLVFLSSVLFAQEKKSETQHCFKKEVIETSTLFLKDNVFPHYQQFVFTDEILKVYGAKKSTSQPDSASVSIFKILSKECKWNYDFTQGETVYKMIQTGEDNIVEYSTLCVAINDKKLHILLKFEEENIFRKFE